MTGEIEWGEPPPGPHGNSKWPKRLLPFVERPGEWGRLPGTYNPAMRTHLLRAAKGLGVYKVPPGRWEFKAPLIPDSKPVRCHLWARYLGPAEPEKVA